MVDRERPQKSSNIYHFPLLRADRAVARQTAQPAVWPKPLKAVVRRFPSPPVASLPTGAAKRVRTPDGDPSPQQKRWLTRGLDRDGGKLPLFDENGQRVSERTVKTCLDRGWAEAWFAASKKPDWLVCRLTERGRAALRS